MDIFSALLLLGFAAIYLGGFAMGTIALVLHFRLKRRVLELERTETDLPVAEPLVEAEPRAAEALEEPAAAEEEEEEEEQVTPSASPAEPKPARPRIEWEKLLGVRGAAVLGGLALVIAAIFFFQHAIQEGWFDYRTRVWTGAITGTLLLIIQGRLRKNGYRIVSDVLAGSGAVVHYASAWAAFRLYHLIPLPVGFAWMAVVTALCCWLAVRHTAQLIAIFGLVGGFATPLLLATTAPSAIGLFGYILILDLALLAIGRRQDWPWLGLLGLFGTTGTQLLWLLNGREEEAVIGLLACGIFGLLFVLLGGPKSSPFTTRWRLGRIAGVLIPFAIAIHYAQLVELGDDYLSIACVVTLLAGAATFVGRKLELHALPIAAAAASAAVAATWLLARVPSEGSLLAFALLTGATSLVLTALDSWPRRSRPGGTHPAAVHSLVLLFVLAYLVIGTQELSLWAVCSVIAVHLAITVWARAALPALPALAGLAAGVSFFAYRIQHVHPGNPAYHNPPVLLLAVILISGALLITAIVWRRHAAPRALALAAVLCATPTLLYFRDWYGAGIPAFYGALALLSIIAALGAARTATSFVYAPVVFFASWALYADADIGFFDSREWPIPEVLPWLALCAAMTTLAPLLAREHLAKTRALGLMAAAAPILGIGCWLKLHAYHFGEHGSLLVLLALALLPTLGYLLLNDETRRAKTAYLMSVCLLLGLAIPAEFRRAAEPMGDMGTISWLLLGLILAAALGSIAARRRTSTAWSTATLAAALLPALLFSLVLLDPNDFHREDNLLLNWTTYHYGLSLAALLLVLRNAATQEAPVHSIHRRLRRTLTICAGGAATLLAFAWLNLAIINGYSDGNYLDATSTDLNRDLVLSLAWALYSFTLLALGTRHKLPALRWASLTFLLATIAKVFLSDLSNLQGLQRAGSFLGLAICLILVSLFYQRFVFTKRE